MSNPLMEQVCFGRNSPPSSSSLLVSVNAPPTFPVPPAPVAPPAPLLLTEVPPPAPVVEPDVDAELLLELVELAELAELLLLAELLELTELLEAEVEAALIVALVGPPVVALAVEVMVAVVLGVPEVSLSSGSDPLHWESTKGRLAMPTGTRNDFRVMMQERMALLHSEDHAFPHAPLLVCDSSVRIRPWL